MAFFKSNTNKTSSDLDLIAGFKASGDLEQLSILFDRYIELVFGLCLKYLKNKQESEDRVMEIYESLIVKLKKHEVTNFKSWLYTLSKNHCIEYLRKNNRNLTKEKQARLMYSEQVFHPDDVKKEVALTQMEKCLVKLPKDQRDCIQLFYLENKSYNQIVEQTGLDWNKIRSFLQNGRRNLKTCMQKNGFGEKL
jgi:RNA polymerase sigma-70 factor (ECF subfamily)